MNNELYKTNPISEKPGMNLTNYMTNDYENKSPLLTMEKQTQTKPTCSELACTELVYTELVEASNQSKGSNLFHIVQKVAG
jgi:hypothetical protein